MWLRTAWRTGPAVVLLRNVPADDLRCAVGDGRHQPSAFVENRNAIGSKSEGNGPTLFRHRLSAVVIIKCLRHVNLGSARSPMLNLLL